MEMYPQLFDSVNDAEKTKRFNKMHKKLSLVQKAKLGVLDRKICKAMKEGKCEVLVDFIEDRLIFELQQRGFFVGTKNMGCATLHMAMFVINWEER